MTKIILTADIHFGVPGKLRDILYSVKTIREYAAKNNINHVIVLGDLFHDRRYIEIDVLSTVYKFFESCKNDYEQEWITFPGNHDMFLKYSWDINSLETLRDVMTIFTDISLISIDDKRFWILPFIAYEKTFMKVVYRLEHRKQPGDNLLTHIGISGSILNSCFMLKEWGHVTFKNSRFNKVFTGHFHCHQQIDNAYYPGSPIPFKFDEGNHEHGFLTYDLVTDQVEFIDLFKVGPTLLPGEQLPPQYITVLDEDLNNLDTNDVKGNIVRLSFQTEPTQTERTQIKEHLELLGAKSIRWMNLYQKQDKLTTIKKDFDVSNKNLFDAYLQKDADKNKDLERHILLSMHNDIVIEGDGLYYQEQENID